MGIAIKYKSRNTNAMYVFIINCHNKLLCTTIYVVTSCNMNANDII